MGDSAAASSFAAGHIAGQHAAEAAAATPSDASPLLNASDSLDAHSQAVLGNGGPFHVERGLGGEMRFVLHITENFFADFALGLLYIVLIGTVAVGVTWATAKGWRLVFGNCGCRMSCVSISQSLVVLMLMFVGVTLSFGSVGVTFNTIFAGLSFVTAGYVVGTSKMSMDFADGLRLISWNLFEDHHKVRAEHLNLEGELIAIGYLSTEILRHVDASSDDPSTMYRRKTTMVRNSVLIDGPLDVWWHTERPTERPVNNHKFAPRHVETVVAAERGHAESVGGATRFDQLSSRSAISKMAARPAAAVYSPQQTDQPDTTPEGLTRRIIASANSHAANRKPGGTKLVLH